MTSTALADCVDVAHTYGRGNTAVVAVHGVTCQVAPRARIAVTGPSGSGKSTLLHLLAGLEPPTTGTLRWPGLGLAGSRPAGEVGLVFQGPSLLPSLDVAENVALPLLLAGTAEAAARQRAIEALGRLDISELAGKLPDELSGGQSQRVAIARVLAARPRLILADEPSGQLDKATATHVLTVLLDAAAELDAALVVSTHDAEIAARLSEQWVMRDGRLYTDVDPDRVAVPEAGR